jgi:1,4-dihydroxy-2-naphthoyl-CoA hydrolase
MWAMTTPSNNVDAGRWLEQMQKIMGAGGPDQNLALRLGIIVTNWDPAAVSATMPVDGNRQPFGLLHGGATAALVETLGSIAASLNQPGARPVGVDLNITHHRAATAGLVTAVCTPLHVGRRMSSFSVSVTDENGKRVATGRLTCALLPAQDVGADA